MGCFQPGLTRRGFYKIWINVEEYSTIKKLIFQVYCMVNFCSKTSSLCYVETRVVYAEVDHTKLYILKCPSSKKYLSMKRQLRRNNCLWLLMLFRAIQSSVLPNLFESIYQAITKGNPTWNQLSVPSATPTRGTGTQPTFKSPILKEHDHGPTWSQQSEGRLLLAKFG